MHVAETYSFLHAHQRYGQTPLDAVDADRYVAQTATVSARLGTHSLPQTVCELHDQLAAYRPDLELTDAAAEAARFLLLHPPLPLATRPGYWSIAAGGVAVLPSWARQMLRLPDRFPAPQVSDGLGRVGAAAVRWGLAALGEDRAEGYRATELRES